MKLPVADHFPNGYNKYTMETKANSTHLLLMPLFFIGNE